MIYLDDANVSEKWTIVRLYVSIYIYMIFEGGKMAIVMFLKHMQLFPLIIMGLSGKNLQNQIKFINRWGLAKNTESRNHAWKTHTSDICIFDI